MASPIPSIHSFIHLFILQVGKDVKIIRDTIFLTSLEDVIRQITYHKGSNEKIHVKSLAQSLTPSEPFFFYNIREMIDNSLICRCRMEINIRNIRDMDSNWNTRSTIYFCVTLANSGIPFKSQFSQF